MPPNSSQVAMYLQHKVGISAPTVTTHMTLRKTSTITLTYIKSVNVTNVYQAEMTTIRNVRNTSHVTSLEQFLEGSQVTWFLLGKRNGLKT